MEHKAVVPKIFGIVIEAYAGGAVAYTQEEAFEAIKHDFIQSIAEGNFAFTCAPMESCITDYAKQLGSDARIVKELEDSKLKMQEILDRLTEPYVSRELARRLNS